MKPPFLAPFQQTRGVKTVDFAGTKEVVYGDTSPQANVDLRDADGNTEREDWPREKLLVRLLLAISWAQTLSKQRCCLDRLTITIGILQK